MAPSLSKTFATALKDVRRARGFTQAEAAERAELAVEAYGRLERGHVLPRADTLVRLSLSFGVSTDQLLGLTRHEAALRAHDEGAGNPDLRRLVETLEELPPPTLRLVGKAIRAIRGEPEEPAPRRR